MNFRIQEVLKNIIPGLLTLVSIYFLTSPSLDLSHFKNEIKELLAIYFVVFLAAVYVFGYFVDWAGSWFERLFYKIWPRPSFYLLNDVNGRINLLKSSEIVDFLCDVSNRAVQSPLSRENAEAIFKVANYLKDKNTSKQVNDRIGESYFSQIFSRNLCVSFFFSFIGYVCIYFFNEESCVGNFNQRSFILIGLGVVTIFRWREHAFYYSRNVLYASCEDVLRL